jgi:hypothetical protein
MCPHKQRERLMVGFGRFGQVRDREVLWLVEWAVERMREGQSMAGLPKKGGCNKFLSVGQDLAWISFLLLPSTKIQGGEVVATMHDDQRGLGVLERAGW